MEYVTTETLDTAEAFLDALGRRDSRWKPSPTQWIFRGQGDAEWKLIPTAFRPDVELNPGVRYGSQFNFGKGPRPTHRHQVLAEFELLDSFVRAADEQGLALGTDAFWNDGSATRTVFRALEEGEDWVRGGIYTPLALAQHHGIPTRLLDFTADPRVAAYFAATKAAAWAKGLLPRPSDIRHLGVWAVSRSLLNTWLLENTYVEEVRVPYSSNPNIRAQSGLFLLISRWKLDQNAPATHAPLDLLAQDAITRAVAHGIRDVMDGRPYMRLLQLPIAEAPKLVRLLADEWISGNRLFHGYDGAARGVEEKRLWDEL